VLGQGEVAEVVRPELQLEPVRRALERRGHHPGVVDQQMQRTPVGGERRAEGPDAGQRGEIHHRDLEVGVGHRLDDRRLGRLALVGAAHAEHHGGARRGEGACGLLAEPGGGARDERPPTPEVDRGEHVVGRRCGVECHGYSSMKSEVPPASSRCLSTLPVALYGNESRIST
jgi:hypothetical protein